MGRCCAARWSRRRGEAQRGGGAGDGAAGPRGGPSSRTAKWPSVLSRRDAALPDEVPVFASLNQLYKVTPKYFEAWANALRRVGDARLWYLEFPRTAAKNLRLQAARRACGRPPTCRGRRSGAIIWRG